MSIPMYMYTSYFIYGVCMLICCESSCVAKLPFNTAPSQHVMHSSGNVHDWSLANLQRSTVPPENASNMILRWIGHKQVSFRPIQ